MLQFEPNAFHSLFPCAFIFKFLSANSPSHLKKKNFVKLLWELERISFFMWNFVEDPRLVAVVRLYLCGTWIISGGFHFPIYKNASQALEGQVCDQCLDAKVKFKSIQCGYSLMPLWFSWISLCGHCIMSVWSLNSPGQILVYAFK